MAFLGYIKCLGYDIFVPVYSGVPANENITNAPTIKLSELHNVGYLNTIEGISQKGYNYYISWNNYSGEEAGKIIPQVFGEYHFETVDGITPFMGLVLCNLDYNGNTETFECSHIHYSSSSRAWYLDGLPNITSSYDEVQLCMGLVRNSNNLGLFGRITENTNQSTSYIAIPGNGNVYLTELTVDNISNFLKLYQENELPKSATTDPNSFMMGYRVGQMIRGMRGKRTPTEEL